jgi:multiple sugar transport system substrate-binding protein
MSRVKAARISRRDFIKLPAAGTVIAASAGAGPFFLFPDRAHASQKTLKIAQWSHFVPGYNEWFQRVYVKEWGQQHDTNVVVDQIPADKINARAAAEVAAGKGHDLFMFPSPPAVYHRYAIDHAEIYQSVASRHGTLNALGHLSTFHPKTKRYFAVADSWIPAVVHFYEDYWAEANTPFGPSNYDTLRAGSRKIRARRGIPCGLALAPGLESNITLQTMLLGYRTSAQDEEGNVAINRSYMTVQALKFAKALYEDGGTPDALKWGPSGNAQAMLARKTSCTVNAISLLRAAEKESTELSANILLRPPMLGPGGVWAVPHVTSCSAIWKFAENQEGAKQFLVDLIDNSAAIFEKSESCNFPIYQNTLPNLIGRLSHDPQGGAVAKYEELKDALKWTRSLCYPGFATPEAMEVFDTAVVPRMFLSVLQGELSPEDAAGAAEKEMKRIYEKWKES